MIAVTPRRDASMPARRIAVFPSCCVGCKILTHVVQSNYMKKQPQLTSPSKAQVKTRYFTYIAPCTVTMSMASSLPSGLHVWLDRSSSTRHPDTFDLVRFASSLAWRNILKNLMALDLLTSLTWQVSLLSTRCFTRTRHTSSSGDYVSRPCTSTGITPS